jgi:hypothetical protein
VSRAIPGLPEPVEASDRTATEHAGSPPLVLSAGVAVTGTTRADIPAPGGAEQSALVGRLAASPGRGIPWPREPATTRLPGVEGPGRLGSWTGPFWSRLLTSLVFLVAALTEWLVRHDSAFAILWCLVAVFPAALAVGQWHGVRAGRASGEVTDDAPG